MERKVVIITGGGKGIGYGVARAFAKENYNLVITGRTKETLEKTKKELEDEFKIEVSYDKDNKTITISDNGIGMDKDELDSNLGTICESGSMLFKKENEKRDDIDIIGQFGVGFYSAFMVAKKIDVLSRKYGEKDAYLWSSEGASGYTIEKDERDTWGTTITLHLKDDS